VPCGLKDWKLDVSKLEPAQYVAHPPYVKGFRHHDGYGIGMRLLYTWLDK